MHIAITTKYGLNDHDHFVKKSVQMLRKGGAKVDVCPGTCHLVPNEKPALDFKKAYDLIIVFGGDGSLLRTVQSMQRFETPVLAINMGRLGFFSESLGKDYKKVLKRVLNGDFDTETRMLLRCTVVRGVKKVFSQRSLNEVTIARDAIARMIGLKTTVNDLKLTTYVADGLVVATPTGSTGYSLSAGGPVVSPQLDSLILTPIAPHSFTQKPIVLLPSSKLKVSISSGEDRVFLTVDGQTGFHLQDHDLVKIKKSSKHLKLVRFNSNSYFHTLRTKLQWGSPLLH